MPARNPRLENITFRAEGVILAPVSHEFIPGAVSLIRKAAALTHEGRDKVGVVSNNIHFVDTKDGRQIADMNLIDKVVAPAPGSAESIEELYTRLLKRLRVKGANTIAVEAGMSGLLAAKKLGCYVIAFASYDGGLSQERYADLEADQYVEGHTNLKDRLPEILYQRPHRLY